MENGYEFSTPHIVEGGLDDPRVRALVEHHLAGARAATPICSVHALDVDGLKDADVAFWALWRGDQLLGVGALKRLDDRHGEIKSMHTAAQYRRSGAGSAILRHIIAAARTRGMTRLSLETGSADHFAPARGLYEKHGFTECPPFADYVEDPYSVYMTLDLTNRSTRGG
jgi:putative acetyltransferase